LAGWDTARIEARDGQAGRTQRFGRCRIVKACLHQDWRRAIRHFSTLAALLKVDTLCPPPDSDLVARGLHIPRKKTFLSLRIGPAQRGPELLQVDTLLLAVRRKWILRIGDIGAAKSVAVP